MNLGVLHPRSPIPGCRGLIGSNDQAARLNALVSENRPRTCRVRARISDKSTLIGSLESAFDVPNVDFFRVDAEHVLLYVHHGGSNAVYLDLVSDERGLVEYVEVECEVDFVLDAFGCARTAVNDFLDVVQRLCWIPLQVYRLDLYVENDSAPIAHEVLLPFPNRLTISLTGGFHQFGPFRECESLIRESVSASSPYYRLLCTFRLCEGLSETRRQIRKIGDETGVEERLPKDPVIDQEQMWELGFDRGQTEGIRTLGQLQKFFTEMRNSAVHFLAGNSEGRPLHASSGFAHGDYAQASAILLHYAHKAFTELHQFADRHLVAHFMRGRILPMPEQRSRFRVPCRRASS